MRVELREEIYQKWHECCSYNCLAEQAPSWTGLGANRSQSLALGRDSITRVIQNSKG
jgi:hypothetical protein